PAPASSGPRAPRRPLTAPACAGGPGKRRRLLVRLGWGRWPHLGPPDGRLTMRRCFALGLLGLALGAPGARAAAPPADTAALAARAQAFLKAHCYRCHGEGGAVEGGINYILDINKLIQRRKVTPGESAKSRLYQRVARGQMPPRSVKARPSAAEVEALRRWIDAGAPGVRPAAERVLVTDAQVFEVILDDLDTLDRRARRFTRYFSLAPLANTGAGPDELRTYTNALAKLLNRLS